MTKAASVFYVLLICVATTYCWDNFHDIQKAYKNIFGDNEKPSYGPIRDNFQNPRNDLRYGHQSHPFSDMSRDFENDLILQQYIQPIMRQLNELLYVVKGWSTTRYPPPYVPFRPLSHPNTDSDKESGDSSGPIVAHRFPDQEDSNQNWGLVTEETSDNKTNSKSNCETTSGIQRSSNYMNTIDTPTRCKAATLSCCIKGYSKQEKKECFTEQRCLKSYETGYACLPVIIQAVYVELYG